MKEDLREEIDKAQKYLDVAGVMFVVIDTDQKVTLINKKGCEILGYKEKEIIGKNWFDTFISKRVRDEVKVVFEKLMAGETESVEYFENPVLTKSGEEKIIAWHNTVLTDDTGNIIGALSYGEDITEHKWMEEALKESEQQYRRIFEFSPEVIGIIDTKGNLLDVNRKLYSWLGYKKEEFIGKNFLKLPFLPDESKAIAMEKLSQSISGKDVQPYKLDFTTKSGERCVGRILSNPIRDENGKLIGELVMASDITEDKQAKDALRQSEEKYRTILESIEEGYYEVDIAGNFTFFNDALCEILGYSRDEMRGMNNRQYMDKENAKKVYQTFNQVYTIGKSAKGFDWRIIRKDGTKRFVEASVSLMRNPEDERIGFRGIVRDITERKKAEEALQVEKAYLDQLFETAQEAIVMSDGNHRVLHVNSEFTRLFGYTHDEAVGQLIDDLVAPKHLIKEAESYTKQLTEGKRFAFEGVRQRKDGTLINVSVIGSPIIIDSEHIGNYAIYRNITERKKIEEKINAIYDLSREMSITMDLDGVFEKVLDACEKVLDFKFISILLVDEKEDRLDIVAIKGFHKNVVDLKFSLMKDKGITVWTAKHGKSLIVPDVSKDPRFIKTDPGIKSELAVPIKFRRKVLGVLNAESEDIDGFSEDDRRLLEILASQAASAIENARLYEQAKHEITERKRMEEKLSAVYDLSRGMTLSLDLDQISEIILDTAERVLNFDNIDLFLVDKETSELCLKEFRGLKEPEKDTIIPIFGEKGITAYVARTGESLNVPDVRKDERYLFGLKDSRSELCVPIKVRDNVIGVIDAESKELNAFSKKDQRLLETLASQAAVAIENAKLFSERERKLRELKVLNNIGRAVTSTLEMDQVVELIYEQTAKLMDTTNFILALFDENTKKFDVVLFVEDGKKMPKFFLELGKGLISQVIKTKKPLLVSDYIEACEKFGIEPVGDRKSKAWLSVPLAAMDKTIGVLNVHSHEERGIYTKEDLEILSAIANQAAIAIENARLFKKEREAALQLEFLNDLMSHDINNINQIAMGYLELLKTPKLSEKQNIFVERALSSVKNSARLIENVRKLQKLRGEKIELEKMDMKDILKEAILEVSQHPEKNIELKFSPKENMWINGSPFLKDVFFNLLDNSIKYTPSKNVKIEVNVEDLGNSAKICVKDWGVGIPDEMKSKIFDRFERLENGVRGSGLGLYISKMIVKKLNGRIWVEDNPEGGSVFCIEFPRVVS